MSELGLNTRIKAALRQPKEECCFSIDINGVTHADERCLAYYYLPDVQLSYDLDLKGGFKKFQCKDESKDQHLDPLLTAIMIKEKSKSKKSKADVISFRGVMTKLLCLPYEKGEDIDLNLELFDGQIFMEEDHEQKEAKKRPMNENQEQMCFYGWKFEALATLDKPWAETEREEIMNRHKKKVNNIEQYCSVVRSGVGKVKTLIGGEVDCVYDFKPSDGSDPLKHYVELKTSAMIEHEGQAKTFERKLFKTWAQSFLIGLPTVIYGFRDQNGFVKSVEEYKVDALPNLIKQGVSEKGRIWNGNDAIAWYGAVLEWIKSTIVEENCTYRLEYKAGEQKLDIKKIERKPFILEDFKEWRNELKSKE